MSPIRVFIDLREVLFQGRGWERYGICLLPELLKDEELRFLFLVENQQKALEHYPFLCSPWVEFTEKALDRQCRFAPQKFAQMSECDIYHCLTEYPEFYPEKAKLVVAMHDTSAFKNPALFSEECLENARKSYSFVINNADSLLVFSETVASDLRTLAVQLETHQKNSLPIKLIPHGLDHLLRYAESPVELPWPKPFFVVVGGFEADKNLNVVLEVFQRQADIHQRYSLILLGPKTPRCSFSKPLHPHIHLQQAVSDETLAAAYRSATALICPSLDEGFGFPPLEALSFGCPVIASDIPVFQETLHEKADFFDPLSALSLEQCWLSFLKRPAHRRIPMKEIQTWKAAAQKTKTLYRSLLSGIE